MTAQELLERLTSLGVRLATTEGRLAFDAPAGVMSPELRQFLTQLKPELLVLLAKSDVVRPVQQAAALPETPGHCLACSTPSPRWRTPCSACAPSLRVVIVDPLAGPRLCRARAEPIPTTRPVSSVCSPGCALAQPELSPVGWRDEEPDQPRLGPASGALWPGQKATIAIDRSSELLELGQRLDWPEIRIAQHLTLLAGEAGWRKFADFGQRWFQEALTAARQAVEQGALL